MVRKQKQILSSNEKYVIQKKIALQTKVIIFIIGAKIHRCAVVNEWYNQHPRLRRLPHPAR